VGAEQAARSALDAYLEKNPATFAVLVKKLRSTRSHDRSNADVGGQASEWPQGPL